MAISLTIYFGAGMLLLRVISNGPFPGKCGIDDYLFGSASVVTIADLSTSAAVGAFAVFLMPLFWREFTLRTFQPVLSTMLGIRAKIVDTLMFSTFVAVIVIGVKAVGVVLMIGFVVTQPKAARQWTSTLPGMVALSGLFGGIGSGMGAYWSIALGNTPTGPVIVLTLFVVFLISLLASQRRSVITAALHQARAREALRRELLNEMVNRQVSLSVQAC